MTDNDEPRPDQHINFDAPAQDAYIGEKFTAVESWRELQSQNIEFTMKRLREPVESGG